MPSVAIATQSEMPPDGFVRSPKRPFPTPLKKPSTPSCCEPETSNHENMIIYKPIFIN